MPDQELNVVIGGDYVTIGAGSQSDVLEALDKGCCTLYLIGHRGGPGNEGGIVTYPSDTGVVILPDPAFEIKLRNRFARNGCTECVINIVSCGDSNDPKGFETRQEIANHTGCTVCGSTKPVQIGKPVLNPCVGKPWKYTCAFPGK